MKIEIHGFKFVMDEDHLYIKPGEKYNLVDPAFEVALQEAKSAQERLKWKHLRRIHGKPSTDLGYVYVVRGVTYGAEGAYKIGSTRYILTRPYQNSTYIPNVVIQTPDRESAYVLERELHQCFESLRVPETREWFLLGISELAHIRSIPQTDAKLRVMEKWEYWVETPPDGKARARLKEFEWAWYMEQAREFAAINHDEEI